MAFNQVNPDALSVPVDNAATGPHVHFLEAFNNAYESNARSSAMFGIEKAFGDIEDEQLRSLKGVGVEAIGRLSENSLDVAKFYEDGGDETRAKQFKDYDTRIDELKTKYPKLNLRNSRELWETVKNTAQDREKKLAANRNTAMGSVGEFLGAAGASIDPRTDPLNFATAPIGGVGKTAVGRIASQAIGQGGIEAVNQLTGVQEERRLLGLSHGFTDALSRVGGAALGGAVIQGVGEGFVAAGKRWFTPGENDPAPNAPPGPQPARNAAPPAPELKPNEARMQQHVTDFLNEKYDGILGEKSPNGMTRQGAARTSIDLDYMKNQLDAWDAEPHSVKPQGDTVLPRPVDSVKLNEFKAADTASVDDTARRIDPRVFSAYDSLTTQRNAIRDEIKAAPVDEKLRTEIDTLSGQINTLRDNMYGLGESLRKTRSAKMMQLHEDRQKLIQLETSKMPPEIAAKREQVAQLEDRISGLSPVIERAYAQAGGEWRASEATKQRITDMIREGGTKLREAAPVADKRLGKFDEVDALFQQPSLTDRAPILEQSSKVEAQMRPDADAADYAKAIIADNVKLYDDALEGFRGSIGKILKDEKDNQISIAGSEQKLDLDKDKISVSLDDGSGTHTVSVRQLLEDLQEAEEALKATTKCSI